ncbi:MAG: 6,7-dimethyl-8-ribityllumazine synthase [Bacteroidetes bacterium]|jgi:6,7-dimethyl-8-ribityllumazine synthase|nr:6,7-dimethyl-8-ribityllumazine synthase [Bacteroidota bacterium]
MSSVNNNLSWSKGSSVPNAAGYKFGIVWAEWNEEITGAMKDGAFKTLVANGVAVDDIIVKAVPGSFELTLGAQWMLENTEADAVICIGCVIQGETRHFDFICNAVANGITQLNIEHSTPVIFGVLTPNDQQQAIDRAGGKHGNKGDEAAITAIKMVVLEDSF